MAWMRMTALEVDPPSIGQPVAKRCPSALNLTTLEEVVLFKQTKL